MVKKSEKNTKPKSSISKSAIDRVPTGIPGLDEIIGGGFVKNSTVLVRGDTGTGKSIFCLQYLYEGALKYKEPGVYISFSESEKVIEQHGLSLGWEMDKLKDENMLHIIRYEPHEVVNKLDQGGGSLRDTIESVGAKRLVIDSLTAYEMVFENNYKANESILTLFELLRKWESTALVTSEYPVTPSHESGGRLGFLTDGIINFYHIRTNSHRVRALEVIKMRDTLHQNEINIFQIKKDGLGIVGKLHEKHF
ncbi:MAG: ATPase domain-containing protein [Candidatus Micrarchaeota archaeon]|nr:AAA family ATPase [Candidatus Micrarchaeota archaeon]MBU1886260.1 AAA family ATPase [Candidatus Micrarchaeota archaeon]